MQSHRIPTPKLTSPLTSNTALGAAALSLILSGCLSDGPNQTGRAFLDEQGFSLNGKVYELTLDSVPLEGFRSALEEPSHLGDTVALLGNWRGIRSDMRMAYSLTNDNLLDTLEKGSSDSAVRVGLGLSFPNWGANSGSPDYLKSTLTGKDSLTLVVHTLEVASANSQGDFEKARDVAERSFMVRRLPMALVENDLAAQKHSFQVIRDTVVLPLNKVYIGNQESLVTLELPHLRQHLTAERLNHRYLMQQVQTLESGPLSDSAGLLLRVTGIARYEYMPSLLFGTGITTNSSSLRENVNRLLPYASDATRTYSVDYVVHEHEPQDSTFTLLPRRGLRFRVERGELLTRLENAFAKQGVSIPSASGGPFDARFFVAYADMQLKLDTAKTFIENNYALDIRAFSQLDSAIEDDGGPSVVFYQLPIDSSKPVRNQWQSLVTLVNTDDLDRKADTLKVLYEPSPDPAYNWLRFHLSSDTSRDIDTLLLTPGREQEWARSFNPSRPLVLTVTPTARHCDIAYKVRPGSSQESIEYKNPSTLKNFTEYADLTERMILPKREAVKVRATQGMQRLLNRTALSQSSGGLFHEFAINLTQRYALQSDTNFIRLNYPILAEARFAPENGKLRAKLHLILIDISQP